MGKFLRKIKNNKTLMNGTMFSMFSFINRGISFVLLIILARYIMPGQYGQLSLFNTIIQLLGFVIALSCQGYFSISYFQRKGELFRQDFTSIILIMTGCTVVISSVVLIWQDSLARIADIPPAFLWYTIIICVSEVLFHMLMDFVRIQEKVVKYGILSCGFALLSFFLSIYLVVYKGLDWQGRVYTHLIIAVLSGLLGLIILSSKKLFSREVTWEGTKTILKWGVPLIPHQAANWIKQGCDRFIIKGAHTIADVGVFSFALNLTGIITMIGIAFNASYSVTIYQILSSNKSAADKIKYLKRQSRNIGLIYTAGYVAVLVLGTLLVFLALPKYRPSLPYFWITSVSGYLNCLYHLFVNYLIYYHKTQNIMVITFWTACLHLVLSLLFTRYSLFFTSVIYVISQLVVLILIARKSLKVVKEKVVD